MNNQYRAPNIGTFFNTKSMDTLWSFIVTLLKYVAPGVMIFVALFLAGVLLKMVVKIFKKGADDDDDKRKDDDEYDVRYY